MPLGPVIIELGHLETKPMTNKYNFKLVCTELEAEDEKQENKSQARGG